MDVLAARSTVELDGVEIVVSDRMRACAASYRRLLERERLVREATGLITFHFRDPDDDWGGFQSSSIEADFYMLMIDANPAMHDPTYARMHQIARAVIEKVVV